MKIEESFQAACLDDAHGGFADEQAKAARSLK